MPAIERFADAGHTLDDFSDHFFVECPSCSGRALVRQGDHRLLCTRCHHTEMPGRWYGAWRLYVSRRCSVCGTHGSRSVETDQQRDKLLLRCSECGDEREYRAQGTHLQRNKGLVTDSVYGLPLWLQGEFQGELCWAFNPEHLDYLRRYVGAKLRERGILPRNTIRKNSSMLSRLPGFIKKARNREALLRFFDQLEQR
ncbi:MAG: hypothetical protein JNL02_13185 [Saprospiraceae bacterium]|nr:hypothetical protein [Saprospiraceae bacterium]